MQEMKFLKKELHARLKVRSSKKRKREYGGDEMASKKVVAKVVEEQSKLACPMSSALITPMLESLFKIMDTSSKNKAKVSDQPIEVGEDASSEVEYIGKCGPKLII